MQGGFYSAGLLEPGVIVGIQQNANNSGLWTNFRKSHLIGLVSHSDKKVSTHQGELLVAGLHRQVLIE